MSDFIVKALQDAFAHGYMRYKPDTIFGAAEQLFTMKEEFFRFPVHFEGNVNRLVRH